MPDLTRADVGLVLVSEWHTTGPDQQRRAADAALDAWRENGAWPPGLLAHSSLLGEDESTVLHYIQWSSEQFADTVKHTAGPGIEHHRDTAYRLYRSTTPTTAAATTGCLVTVTVDFDGPDPQRQRAWVDGVFAAAGTADASAAAGLLAAHFHISTDGTRVLNLAEWTTPQAHRDAVAAPAQPLRTATQKFPGVTGIVVQRFQPYRSVTASPLG